MQPRPEISRSRAAGALAAILGGAFLLRMWHLGARSVWLDEGSTWTAATASLPELIRLCAEKDASPPLFYLLTAVLMRLGDGEEHLRFVSVAASIVLVLLTYRLARLCAGRGEALLAAGIAALSPFQLMYAQEARSYMLVATLAVASHFFFLRAVFEDRRRDWVPYVVVTSLALYTQAIAMLMVGVQGAVALATRDGRRRILVWLLSLGVCLALYVPWVVVSLHQVASLGDSHWYLEAPGGRELFQVLRAIFLSPIALVTPPMGSTTPGLDAVAPRALAQLVLLVIPAVPLLAAAVEALRRDRTGRFVRLHAAALLLPLAAVLALLPWKALWLARYFVFLTPFVAVLHARGLRALWPRALSRAWTVLFLLSSLYACVRYDLDYTKERWRDVVRTIGETSTPGRTAALVTFNADAFHFYNAKLESPIAAFEVSHPDVPFASDFDARQLDEMMRRAAARSEPFDEVWVVVVSPISPVRREVVRRTEEVAARGRRVAGRWKWDAVNGPLRVVRYVRAS